MEPKITVPVLEIEFAGAVIAAEINTALANHIIYLNSEGDFDVIFIGRVFRIGKSSMRSAVTILPDL